jgi:probable HAF family extracellular repeat protein
VKPFVFASAMPALASAAIVALTTLAATPILAQDSAARPPATPPRIVHIGEGHPYSGVNAINNRQQVVGMMNFPDDEGRFHAYVWDDGVMRDLTPDGGGSQANDINDRGQIVGIADLGDGIGAAVLWEDGRMVPLEQPAGVLFCVAQAINDRGVIAGYCETPSGTLPLLWRRGVPEPMAVPAGVRAIPQRLNDRGVVIGTASRAVGTRFPFVWSDGRFVDVNTISDRPFELVAAINNRGQIVGEGPGPDGRGQGLLLEDRRTVVIAPVPGASAAIPYGLNDRGQVVGASGACGFVWSDGRMQALTCLPGGSFAFGTAINERGDVAGQATTPPDNFLPNAVLWPGAAKHPPRGGGR